MNRHGRSRSDPGLLRFALTGHWTVGAAISAGSLVIGLVVLPLTLGRIPALSATVTAIEPLWWASGLLFGAIALWRGASATRLAFAGEAEMQDLDAPLPPPQGRSGPGGDSDIRRFRLPPESEHAREWTLDLLRHVDSKRFNLLCRAYFRESGIPAETARDGNGRADIRLREDPATPHAVTAVVRCEVRDLQIGESSIHELCRTMKREAADRGCFVTCGDFTPQARRLASEERVELIDGPLLLEKLRRLPDSASRRLLSMASERARMVPSCPRCGGRMMPRLGERGRYWGCEGAPRCQTTLAMRDSVPPRAVRS